MTTILPLKDRVKETTTSTGSGSLSLTAATGYQTFSGAYPDANGSSSNFRFYYVVAGGAEWEIGIGYHSTGGTFLNRESVLRSSNSDALVTFSAGDKDVFSSLAADPLSEKPSIGKSLALATWSFLP